VRCALATIIVVLGVACRSSPTAARLEPRDASASSAAPDRTLDNLVAAARLFGYVRFFHPSDEAAKVDFDDLAATMMERAEPSRSTDELALALREAIAPVAPSVVVWSGARPEPASAINATSSVRWRHRGVTLHTSEKHGNRYASERVVSPKAAAPLAAVEKELGAGIGCRVPVAIPVDDGGRTLPRASAPIPASHAHGARAVHLASIAFAWNVFEHFYPYFDVVDADWPKALRSALAGAQAANDEEAFTRVLRELVAKLHDGHGAVTRVGAKANFLPIEWTWASGDLVATASHAPISRGDTILAIDGRSIADLYAAEGPQISAATEGYLRNRALVTLRQVDTPEPVLVKLRRISGEEATVHVPRRLTGPFGTSRPANGAEVAPGIVYASLANVDHAAFAKMLPALAAAKGIVFDLRAYPGDAGVDALEHLATGPMTSAA
jgi:hypothetical protein